MDQDETPTFFPIFCKFIDVQTLTNNIKNFLFEPTQKAYEKNWLKTVWLKKDFGF